jgi:hypothetical protein
MAQQADASGRRPVEGESAHVERAAPAAGPVPRVLDRQIDRYLDSVMQALLQPPPRRKRPRQP